MYSYASAGVDSDAPIKYGLGEESDCIWTFKQKQRPSDIPGLKRVMRVHKK